MADREERKILLQKNSYINVRADRQTDREISVRLSLSVCDRVRERVSERIIRLEKKRKRRNRQTKIKKQNDKMSDSERLVVASLPLILFCLPEPSSHHHHNIINSTIWQQHSWQKSAPKE